MDEAVSDPLEKEVIPLGVDERRNGMNPVPWAAS